jgi:3-deoxy-manno-octulosonate cytidylyltransferase (CMP-KDO synthetase)
MQEERNSLTDTMASAPQLSARRIVGVIPARFDSERLPGKVLRPICGKAMVHVVYERARACPLLDGLWVATDSERVRDYCAQNEIPVLLTSRAPRSGTERILEVIETLPADGRADDLFVNDVFVNIQADEPMVTAEHLRLLIEPFFTPATSGARVARPEILVTTLKTPLDPAEAPNPNVVKVVTNLRGEAVYFSRAPIPYRRNPDSGLRVYKHLGFYAYRRAALERYRELPAAPLEETERLEQLRFLEHGIPIQVAETAEDTIGVDTEEDWLAVTKYFEAQHVL